jgi:hypothetical protein
MAFAGFLIAGAPLLAHHSFAAEYDSSKKVELKGVVTKFEWMNPHAHFYLDVSDKDGKVANWNLELASPNMLVRERLEENFAQGGGSSGCRCFSGEGRNQYGQRRNGHAAGRAQVNVYGGAGRSCKMKHFSLIRYAAAIMTGSLSFLAGQTLVPAPPAQTTPARRARGPALPAGPAPRLPDGTPDLSGVWMGGGSNSGDITKGLKPGEEVVMLPWAEKLMKGRKSQDDPQANCLPFGVSARRTVSLAYCANSDAHRRNPYLHHPL